MSTLNIKTVKQYRTTLDLPNNGGHLTLTTEQKPEDRLNRMVKEFDTQLFFTPIGGTTYIHANSNEGPVIGQIDEQIRAWGMSQKFYNEARRQDASVAA